MAFKLAVRVFRKWLTGMFLDHLKKAACRFSCRSAADRSRSPHPEILCFGIELGIKQFIRHIQCDFAEQLDKWR